MRDPERLLLDVIDALAAGRLPRADARRWLVDGLRRFGAHRQDLAVDLGLRGRAADRARRQQDLAALVDVVHTQAGGRALSTRQKARLAAALLAGAVEPADHLARVAIEHLRQRGVARSPRHLMRLLAPVKARDDAGVTLGAALRHWRPPKET